MHCCAVVFFHNWNTSKTFGLNKMEFIITLTSFAAHAEDLGIGYITKPAEFFSNFDLHSGS